MRYEIPSTLRWAILIIAPNVICHFVTIVEQQSVAKVACSDIGYKNPSRRQCFKFPSNEVLEFLIQFTPHIYSKNKCRWLVGCQSCVLNWHVSSTLFAIFCLSSLTEVSISVSYSQHLVTAERSACTGFMQKNISAFSKLRTLCACECAYSLWSRHFARLLTPTSENHSHGMQTYR